MCMTAAIKETFCAMHVKPAHTAFPASIGCTDTTEEGQVDQYRQEADKLYSRHWNLTPNPLYMHIHIIHINI